MGTGNLVSGKYSILPSAVISATVASAVYRVTDCTCEPPTGSSHASVVPVYLTHPTHARSRLNS